MNSSILLAVSNAGWSVFKPLYWFFGVCMNFLMEVLNNEYFLAILIFVILTRVVLLPLNIHQQKTTAKTSRLQPKIQKIQKKYPNPQDRAKVNEETQELYAREGHNQMQMGCGPMMFQMIFLMGIIGIIYYPLSYVIGMDITSQADEILKVIQDLGYKGNYMQLGIIENFAQYKDVLMADFPKLFTPENNAAIEAFRSGMSIGSLDMTAIPDWKDGLIIIVPIMCLVTSLLSTLVNTLIQKKTNPAAAQQMKQMMVMTLMMPFFSFYISFKVPAAVGFYWIISNVIAIVQQLFLAKFFPPKRSLAKLMVQNTIERRSREANVKKIK